MIGSSRNLRVWAYPGAADLRLGYDGLAGLVWLAGVARREPTLFAHWQSLGLVPTAG